MDAAVAERLAARHLNLATDAMARLQFADAGNHFDWLTAHAVPGSAEHVHYLNQAGLAYLNLFRQSGSQATLGRARDQYESAYRLARGTDVAVPPFERVQIAQNLAGALNEFVLGDRRSNLERAIALNEEAISILGDLDSPELVALGTTNLALIRIELAKSDLWLDTQSANPLVPTTHTEPIVGDGIEMAIAELKSARRIRAVTGDVVGQAYTELNLGHAYSRRVTGVRKQNILASRSCYRRALLLLDPESDPYLRVTALHNLANSNLLLSDLVGPASGDAAEYLTEAASFAELAIEGARQIGPGTSAYLAALHLTAKVRTRLGSFDEAILAYVEVVDLIDPTSAPAMARDVGRELATLADHQGDAMLAARGWRLSADGAYSGWASWSTPVQRRGEIVRDDNVFRWAAAAMTSVGALTDAIEVLEMGKARELGRRLAPISPLWRELRRIDPELADELFALVRTLTDGAVTSIQPLGSPLWERDALLAYQERVVRARLLPGLERFDRPFDLDDIKDSIDVGEALVYLFSSPIGTTAIAIWKSDDEVFTDWMTDGESTSERLMGFYWALPGSERIGYLPATNLPEYIRAELHPISIALAPTVKWVADLVERASISSLSVLPSGLLWFVPIHCLTWSEAADSECLLDRVPVSFAPSAQILRLSRAQSRERRNNGSLVMGNPAPHAAPLPGAEVEAIAIAAVLESPVTLLLGSGATKEVVLRQLGNVAFAHLACHGVSAALAPEVEPYLSLSNEEQLSASEILTLDCTGCELVVVSACQSGVHNSYDSIDEVETIGAAFVGAGARSVVSSLWNVDDLATAILMTRFYEYFWERDRTLPADALRRAQTWLRDSTSSGLQKYWSQRPSLREAVVRSRQVSTDAAFGPAVPSSDRPFRDVRFWGAFTLLGGSDQLPTSRATLDQR